MKYTTKAQSLSEQCQKERDGPEVVASEEGPPGFRVLHSVFKEAPETAET